VTRLGGRTLGRQALGGDDVLPCVDRSLRHWQILGGRGASMRAAGSPEVVSLAQIRQLGSVKCEAPRRKNAKLRPASRPWPASRVGCRRLVNFTPPIAGRHCEPVAM
jgi:hypothetical protein